jgi:hypothetical protein
MFGAMTGLIRKQAPTKGTRNVFGLLFALWVSLAIQPCAVAEVSEHSCPHCPTEVAAASDSSHHHGGPAHHAATQVSPSCESMQADCCDLDEGIANVRVELPDLDDATAVLTAAAPPQIVDVPRREANRLADPPDPPDDLVPVHLKKCVFLK